MTMALLLIVGLAIADVATYTSLRSSLLGQVDEQVGAAQHQAYDYLVFLQRHRLAVTARGLGSHVSPDVFVLLLGPDGKVVLERPSGSPSSPDPEPAIRGPLRIAPTPQPRTFGRREGTFRPSPDMVDVGASGDPRAQYRVGAVAVPQGTLVAAVSLNPTLNTLDSLLEIEIGVSVAVVVALMLLGLWTVRRGLRPLAAMTETAGAIASGDLTRRVPSQDPSTEVGQLGQAFNSMLVQIEGAFTEKTRSENRLRQFVADASHELRTPLTSIRGYAELLAKGGFADREGRERALARIEQEATRMGGLVDDLLLLARLDQGRPLLTERVDLADVASDVVSDARTVDLDRPIVLQAGGPVEVAGDTDRLGQVAHNLLRNALQHTPPGTPVEVEVAVEAQMGVLRVTDHGPGLSDEQLAHVFDRFYRNDSARGRGGTGLGLAIVRAIAEALGGTASVESSVGTGSSFTVRVPRWPSRSSGELSDPSPARRAGRAGLDDRSAAVRGDGR
jgi:two-component system OmpR family sensor kinase